MSDRRVPRYDIHAAGTAAAHDDYSAELPYWPPRGKTAAPTSSPARFEKAGEAPPPASPAFTLSEPVQMLVMMIGAYHRESDTAAIERAVAHYSGVLGIHLLARPMEDQAQAPP